MATKTLNIYQFKITLKHAKPKIWRRIQVPSNYNFAELHIAIQDAMGWEDYHLHQFEVINPKTGAKDFISVEEENELFDDVIPGTKAKIAKYFLAAKDKSIYEYDFGDGWEHEIILEKILPAIIKDEYPQCIAGERACPPEDCGGVWGYEHLLKVVADPNHPEYEERIEWLGDDFNPEAFDAKLVKFSNSKKLL